MFLHVISLVERLVYTTLKEVCHEDPVCSRHVLRIRSARIPSSTITSGSDVSYSCPMCCAALSIQPSKTPKRFACCVHNNRGLEWRSWLPFKVRAVTAGHCCSKYKQGHLCIYNSYLSPRFNIRNECFLCTFTLNFGYKFEYI